MVKITKRVVEAAVAQEKDYVIWDDELSGFGVRVFGSGGWQQHQQRICFWRCVLLGADAVDGHFDRGGVVEQAWVGREGTVSGQAVGEH